MHQNKAEKERYPRKRNYREGDWFSIPLATSGYFLGLVARARNGICVGYFYGPHRSSRPALLDAHGLSPQQPTLLCRFGDFGIRTGEWTRAC